MISNQPTPEILKQEMDIAESIFGSLNDPEQMPITMESWNKLLLLNPNCVLYETDEGNKLVSWVVVVPTSKILMNRFLNREINENQLLKLAEPGTEYEALYLSSAITVPEYRRSGFALKLFKLIIKQIPLREDYELYAWPTTETGRRLMEKLSSQIGKKILIRE